MRKSAFEPCIPSRGTKVPYRPEWLHEIKHDGYGLLIQPDGKRVRLSTRNGHDWSDKYPLIAEAALRNRSNSFVIDGEAVLLGFDGRSDFDGPHSRILVADGEDVRELPLSMRKTNLSRLFAGHVDGIFLSDFEQGEIGPDLYRHACLLVLEGLQAQRSSVSAWTLFALGKNEEFGASGHEAGAGCAPMVRPFLRGQYLDERRRRPSIDAADNHMRCPTCGGWIDFSDLGCVVDHAGPLPHPAIDQPQ